LLRLVDLRPLHEDAEGDDAVRGRDVEVDGAEGARVVDRRLEDQVVFDVVVELLLVLAADRGVIVGRWCRLVEAMAPDDSTKPLSLRQCCVAPWDDNARHRGSGHLRVQQHSERLP